MNNIIIIFMFLHFEPALNYKVLYYYVVLCMRFYLFYPLWLLV